MTVTIANKHTLDYNPNFSFQDRAISITQLRSTYLPQIYVPQELKVTVSQNSIDIDIRYDIDDVKKDEIVSRRIKITKGEDTGRIFSINATFGGDSFSMLLRRLENIKQEIRKSMADSNSINKSYKLIISAIDEVMNHLNKESETINAKLFS